MDGLTSTKELEARLNPAYDEALKGINECDGFPVIIWGASGICKQLINYINGRMQVTVWDSKTAGSVFKGYNVLKPRFDLDTETKEKAYVIMAFTTERNYEVCGRLLEENGFQNRINGMELLEHLTASKALKDYKRYKELNTDSDFEILDDNLSFRIDQSFLDAGESFYNTGMREHLWAAKRIYANMPKRHYDLGSSIRGVITHLLSFGLDTVLIDIRPLETAGIENLTFIQSDAASLSGIEDESVESISTIDAICSFGLGRYNDPVDPQAFVKTLNSIQRVLKPGGNLYLSALVSNRNSLLFNCHRVVMPTYVVEKLSKMELLEFSLASETKGVVINHPLTLAESGDECGYYKGLFHFRKK